MDGTDKMQLTNHVSSRIEQVPTTGALNDELSSEPAEDVASIALDPLDVDPMRPTSRSLGEPRRPRGKKGKQESRQRKTSTSEGEEIERFDLFFRIQHFMMILFVSSLIITGLPVKFHDSVCAEIFFTMTGGWGISALIHRIAACGLALTGALHLYYLAATKNGRRDALAIIPRLRDVRDVMQIGFYFMGIAKHRPRFGRFSFIEKFEFLAVYWGMAVMAGTGSILWFESVSMKFLPKYVMDVAKEVHSGEGLLAALAIIIWHFYHVHLAPDKFPMSRVFWTGRISLEEMAKDHPEELDDLIQKGVVDEAKAREYLRADR